MTQTQRRITIGVLALQGAFSEHIQLLRKAFEAITDGVTWAAVEVRTEAQLTGCDALIVPGGESTAIALVAARSGLLEPLRSFVKYVQQPFDPVFADVDVKDPKETRLGNMRGHDLAG